MPCAHKTELRVESPSGEIVFGFVVVGIPENRFLELKAKFPDEGFKEQNPKLKSRETGHHQRRKSLAWLVPRGQS